MEARTASRVIMSIIGLALMGAGAVASCGKVGDIEGASSSKSAEEAPSPNAEGTSTDVAER